MISLQEIRSILDDKSAENLEHLAQESRQITQQFWGRTISLYAPIYISNYCSSHCAYCGFHNHHRIKRVKLTAEQMHKEMSYIAQNRIQNILILTGESYQATPLLYLKEAVLIAKKYFSGIYLEIHPLEEDEYHELFLAGADGVTIYQETYNRKRYGQVHLSGKKKDYDYRYTAPERISLAGMRQISLGILLGLHEDVAEDIFSLFEHLRFMEKNYPGVEYSVSFPRMRPMADVDFHPYPISDELFIKLICLTRINFPRVGINLSTRENASLRDHALELGVTRISAASSTSVGGYTIVDPEAQDPQFPVQDHRSVDQIIRMLKQRQFDPVLTDWRKIENSV